MPERFKATKARRVLSALERIGWTVVKITGSHEKLARPGWPNVIFAYHDDEEIGPRILSQIAKETGLKPDDL
ncbi:type II toxin-antitoxin system HicA family toxin [Acidobacteria bacterium ACD]|nr:MAG: type II toxin-antitoxin system HicA family toxin [Acidobacteriota bacterium]MCE7956530.1 type II toxin-antitoxin system HicA family toxin [Acidobacteria bacterium ACB2]MDL1948824.1 type II toxin-antitoxin system HicA family toxin [Acidobacteria bacterium ACD]